MTLPSVDAVVYTNDVKVRALLSLDIFMPTLKQNRIVLLYDDNPSEIMPFYQSLAERNPFCIELIHTRLAGAKRRDKKVMVPDAQGEISEKSSSASVGYTYNNGESKPVESFDDASPDQEVTIFDHYVVNGKGLVVVI